MINAAIVGLGWWGKTLVEAVQADSPDLHFVAGTTRTRTPEVEAFAAAQQLRLAPDYAALLADPTVEAVVLATPHSLHGAQVVAAAAAGKHIFCEKPFALTVADATAAVAAAQQAGVTLGLGYNRRFHPEMVTLRERIRAGDLGTILHVEATMTFPNALALKPEAWRANREETPCGGLTPMGVHAVDGMIDLCGPIAQVFCQSFRRVVAVDADDTTSILFRMQDGMSGYLGTMTATGPGFSFQVFGSKGWVRLEGMTHVAGASSEERRTRLFSTGKFQPVKGPAEVWEAARLDVTRAALDAFAQAASGGAPRENRADLARRRSGTCTTQRADRRPQWNLARRLLGFPAMATHVKRPSEGWTVPLHVIVWTAITFVVSHQPVVVKERLVMAMHGGARDQDRHAEAVRFRRIEGIEDAVRALRIEPNTGVAHGDDNRAGLVLVAADQDLSGPVRDRLHSLDAVHDEIQENLLELDPVAEHRP